MTDLAKKVKKINHRLQFQKNFCSKILINNKIYKINRINFKIKIKNLNNNKIK